MAAGLFLDPRVPTASAFAAITSLVLRRIAVARPKDAFFSRSGALLTIEYSIILSVKTE